MSVTRQQGGCVQQGIYLIFNLELHHFYYLSIFKPQAIASLLLREGIFQCNHKDHTMMVEDSDGDLEGSSHDVVAEGKAVRFLWYVTLSCSLWKAMAYLNG